MATSSETYILIGVTEAKPPHALVGFENERLMGLPKAPHDEFQHRTKQTRIMPTYEDPESVVNLSPTRFRDIVSPYTARLPPAPCIKHEVVGDGLCSTCEDVNVRTLLGGLGSGRRYSLDSARGIFSCQHCTLCGMLTDMFTIHTGRSRQAIRTVYSNCIIILTSACSTYPRGSRRERKHELLAYMVDSAHGTIMAQVPIRLLADDAFKLGQSPLCHGRLVRPVQADMGLARKWLDECEKHHDCAEILRKARRSSKADEPLVVIDVKRKCLCEIHPQSRYLTLSYVWPRFRTTQLNTHNRKLFMNPGAFEKSETQLPNVIQDAITVTSWLNERYLWVDALCIVQDDMVVKSGLMERMDRIYGDAVLNIVVATADPPEKDYSIPGVGEPRTGRQAVNVTGGLHFVTAFPDYDRAVGQSHWATRGWTFQEGILAQRCLVFHDNQMYFRCASDARCEDVNAEGNKTYKFHPANPYLRNTGFDQLLQPSFFKSNQVGTPFTAYAQLVRDFSHRSLTYESDVINAFRGIMKVTDAFLPTGGHFYGLPFALFDQSLLWYPTSPSRRRQFVNDTIPAWPSWSWASWVGSVDYEVDILHLGGSRFVYPVNEWYRYDLDHSRLVCIPEREPENSPFALGLLYSRIDILRRNPACIIAWVTSFRMTLSSEESHAANWVTDTEQSVPFFTILDHEGDPCGFLPSTNRDWARRFKATGGRECELVSLCYVRQSAGHELGRGGFTFHKKYQAVDNPYVCFYNVILVDYEDGIAYRQGIGRIHQDALRTINHVRKIMILG